MQLKIAEAINLRPKRLILIHTYLYSNCFSSLLFIIYKARLQFIILICNFNFNILTYSSILTFRINLSKYSIKYLGLLFVSTSFEMTILLISKSQIVIHYKILILVLLFHQISTFLYYQENVSLVVSQLMKTLF